MRYNRALDMPLVVLLAALVALSSAPAYAQQATSRFAPVERLIGAWQGTSEGEPGSGSVTREYSLVLNGRFIEEKNRSVYPPQPKNKNGETHEHFSVFSVDNARKRIVFRQFHVEGFVNQYVSEPSSDANTIVFVTEAIENIPPGYRARETYRFLSNDEFEEIFEIAEPGKDFAPYSRARLKRVK